MDSLADDPSDRQAIPSTSSTPAKVIPHPSAPPSPGPTFLAPIPGLMPFGTITLLCGASQVGKTCLVAEWMARLRDGRSICRFPTNQPTGLGIIAADRSWESYHYWFTAAGFPEIAHYSMRDDLGFNWQGLKNSAGLPTLFGNAIKKLGLPPGSLIMVDPLSVFIHGSLMDYKTTLISLAELNKVCQSLKVSILGIMHMAKQKGDKKDRYSRPQDRILGSAALGGFSDTQFYLIAPDDTGDEYYEVGWIPHTRKEGHLDLVRDLDSGLFVPYNPPEKQDHLDAILLAITDAPEGTKTREITDTVSEQTGLNRFQIQRQLSDLAELGRIKHVKHGVWRRTV